jgi:hypothetical protein
MELSLPGDVDRVFKGKAEKALPKTDDPSREELATLLPGDVDRVFRGKAEKALPKTDDPSREDRQNYAETQRSNALRNSSLVARGKLKALTTHILHKGHHVCQMLSQLPF